MKKYLTKIVSVAYNILPIIFLLIISGCGRNENIKISENKNQMHSNSQMHHSENVSKEPGIPSIEESRTPSFAFDSGGKLWCAWVFGDHVYVSYSDDEGESFSKPVQVNKEPQKIAANGENRPKIVISKNENIYISYSISLEERFTGLVKFSVSTDRGKTFSKPVTINDDAEIAGHGFESVGINDEGIIYLFWLDSRLSNAAKKDGKEYNGSSIFYTYSEDDGKTFKPNKKIADHVCQCCRIALDFDNNLPVIIYRDIIDDNIRDHSLIRFTGKENYIEAQRVSFENWKIDACPHHGPSLYIDDTGTYHFTWFNMEGEDGNVYYAKSENKGKSFKDKKMIASKTASHPYVNGTEKNILIVWKEYKDGKNIITQIKSTDSGKIWGDEELILTSKEDIDHPFLIRNKNKIILSEKGKDKIYILEL